MVVSVQAMETGTFDVGIERWDHKAGADEEGNHTARRRWSTVDAT